ncbi:MAG: hypothetical protein C4318_02395 [Acidimicrobiia bacterium]
MGFPQTETPSGAQGGGADPGFLAGTPRGATQELFDARDAAPSRYDITPPQTPSSQESLPPPGWGPKGSTTSWSIASGQSPTPVIPPAKVKRKSATKNLWKELQGYLKVLAILAVAVAGVVLYLQSRANSADLKVTIFGPPEGKISGSLVVKDSAGEQLGRREVSETGARCTFYKRVDLTIRAKKSSDYYFEWDGVTGNSLSDGELRSKGYALVLDIRRGTPYVTAGAPSQVC